MESEFTFRCPDLRNKSFNSFANFRKKNKFFDVIFEVGTQNIPAHRVIVAAAIPYLQKVLDSTHTNIAVEHTDPGVFQRLIDFAYGYELKITMDNVRGLLFGARGFLVDSISKACCDFVAEELRPDNALSFRELATQLDYSQLMEIVDHYIKEHFTEIYETQDFLNCRFHYIKELIGKEDLQVDREEKVFEAVLRWVKACPDDRKIHLPDLLRQVRMPLIRSEFFANVVEREELIRSTLVNWNLVEEAENCILCPQSRKGRNRFSAQPRQLKVDKASSSQNASPGICKLTVQVECTSQNFDFTRNAWHTKGTCKYITSTVYATELNHKMHILHWGSPMIYDPANNNFLNFPSPLVPRYIPGITSLKDKIYICGGTPDGQTILNTVECFNAETNNWSEIKRMKTARYGPAAVSLGDYMYVLGGADNLRIHNSVEKYSTVTGEWTTLEPMLTQRQYHCAAALNGKIYVCGGCAFQSSSLCIATAEVYDPVRNQWEFIAPMNTARHTFILLSCRGKLYALGGFDGSFCRLYSCEVYDPKSDKWSAGPVIDPDCYSSAAIVT